ncbi:MAG TPA: TIGR02449 family protein [Xanthomonadaceae bacterium]|jgi:cell division protein ZapB|nr:TIGR02449 family protein [Xanthomonadaceae bacterium]
MKPDPRDDLATLAARIEALAALVRRLADENATLRQAQSQLAGERALLLSKNEQARSRVEAMIQRLKSMEPNP